ncbi:hypothetical protein [Microbacterium sp. 1.5R]|uniref:hypothetical protein n=1 Tax=Microbacterium sp. 1.5R TaxID=1916917 RepID=UPI00119F2BA8|nr:hypothetical protein [Microbacterium sp. 1.5R]
MTDPQQQHPPQAPQAAQPQGQPYQNQPHQGQPYQNQPYPNQPYANQSYPNQPYPGQAHAAAPETPRASGSALGRIAFIAALVALGIRLLSTMLAPLLYTGDYYGVLSGINSVLGFIVFLGNAGALAVGIIALRRSGPHLLAAIAVGLAGASLVGYLATVLSSAFAWIAY